MSPWKRHKHCCLQWHFGLPSIVRTPLSPLSIWSCDACPSRLRFFLFLFSWREPHRKHHRNQRHYSHSIQPHQQKLMMKPLQWWHEPTKAGQKHKYNINMSLPVAALRFVWMLGVLNINKNQTMFRMRKGMKYESLNFLDVQQSLLWGSRGHSLFTVSKVHQVIPQAVWLSSGLTRWAKSNQPGSTIRLPQHCLKALKQVSKSHCHYCLPSIVNCQVEPEPSATGWVWLLCWSWRKILRLRPLHFFLWLGACRLFHPLLRL